MADNGYQAAMLRQLGIISSMGAMPPGINRVGGQQQQSMGSTPSGTQGSGNRGLLDFGKFLQSRGFRVSEHGAFGGVTQGAHVRGSDHYKNQAIDVNFAPGTSSKEQKAIDAIMKYARQYGMSSIWRAPGHYNHAHFYYK
jgi:hypothetical protein